MPRCRSTAIPKRLSHLLLDERGLPIPYYLRNEISASDDTHYLDIPKVFSPYRTGACAFCGCGLGQHNFSFLIQSGSNCFEGIAIDPPMHLWCASFAALKQYPMVTSVQPGYLSSDKQPKVIMMRPQWGQLVCVWPTDLYARTGHPECEYAFKLGPCTVEKLWFANGKEITDKFEKLVVNGMQGWLWAAVIQKLGSCEGHRDVVHMHGTF
jgi:hypothetical protein